MELSLRVRFPGASLGRMCCLHPWGFFPGAMSTGHHWHERRQVNFEVFLTALNPGPTQLRTGVFAKYSLWNSRIPQRL